MILIEKTNVGIYNYQGKLVGQPRWPNMRLENIRSALISISNDTLAVRDANDAKSNFIAE